MGLHPVPVTMPVPCGPSLPGCVTPPEQLETLLDAGRRYRSFKYWDKVRVGSSEAHLTGRGFNAVKFDPKKPARTIRRNDGNLGMQRGDALARAAEIFASGVQALRVIPRQV